MWLEIGKESVDLWNMRLTRGAEVDYEALRVCHVQGQALWWKEHGLWSHKELSFQHCLVYGISCCLLLPATKLSRGSKALD